MLDKKKFDNDLQIEREKQISLISEYLKEAIKLNAKVRDLPFSPDDSEKLLNEIKAIPISRTGRNTEDIANELIDKVFSKSMLIQHPKFVSFVTSAVSPYSLAGAVLSDIYNINVAGFELSPGGTLIEQKLIKWMGSLAGFSDECGGVFTSGGSLSNLTGCICAKLNIVDEYDLPKAVAYTSDQAHSSVRKGLKLMGLRKDQIRIIPTDDDFKIDLQILENQIKEDIEKGNIPFLIVGNLGSTNTGSIDPIDKLADIRDKYHMWLHMDGAFGGSILFSDIYRNYAKGISRADTLSWDTHKWGMQSYSSSCIICRDKKLLINAFAEHPEYLADVINEEYTDGWDLGIEMSRPARCLKLWFTVQAMGTDLLSEVIDYSFHNMNVAKNELEKYPDFELTSTPMCATLTFRYAPKDIDPSKYDELNAEISQKVIQNDYAYVVTTVIKNKRVLRLNLINANTTSEDVVSIVDGLNDVAKSLHDSYK